MPSCEKCWADSHGDPEKYAQLLGMRTCSPEDQAGPDAKWCPLCGRKTLHQLCEVCMNPKCVLYDPRAPK